MIVSNAFLNVPKDAKTHSGIALFSCTLVSLIPLVLGLYWPLFSVSQGAAVAMLRPLILSASLLLAVTWYYARITSAEVQAACVLGLLSGALFVTSLTSVEPARALADWVKILVLFTITLLLSRALRHEATAKCFGVALILAGVLVGAFILITYLRSLGFVMPTYKLTRIFKGVAERADIPLNAVPFTSVFSFLLGMCLVRANRLLWLVGAALFIISSVFTGSRTPLAVLLISIFAVLVLNALRSPNLPVRVAAYLIAIALPLAITVFVTQTSSRQMSAITEGRWDLWYVAYKKFVERPLFGFGFSSWHDDLASMMPGEYALTAYMNKNILGAYHNEYLGLLADQGLVGFLPAMLLVGFLSYSSWKCAFRSWSIWQGGQWVLVACIFLLIRACVEMPGLFGEGREPADFLAYIFVAIVVSRFSVEEDFLRTHTSSAWNRADAESSAHSSSEAQWSPYGARWPQRRDVPLGLGRSHV